MELPSLYDLRGRTAVVTGAAAGIGRGVAHGLAACGASVAVSDLDADGALAVADELRSAGKASIGVPADVTSTAAVEHLVSRTVDAFGGVDILVAVAGGFPSRQSVEDISDDEWELSVSLNLSSVFRCCRAVVPRMREQGRGGRIVTVSSAAGRTPVTTTAAHYAAAKAGVLGLTRHLARELGADGITVNSVAPGATRTPRLEAMYSDERFAFIASLTPLGRVGEIDDQVGPVVFLASDAAGYMTGATLDVNGGRVML